MVTFQNDLFKNVGCACMYTGKQYEVYNMGVVCQGGEGAFWSKFRACKIVTRVDATEDADWKAGLFVPLIALLKSTGGLQ